MIRVVGVINPSSAGFISSAIKQAETEHAGALIIQLDTPGGLDLSMRAIIKEMLAATVPIVVYVSPSGARAASAGAFLTISAHVAAMAPGTNIGAAHPVQLGGRETDEEMAAKIENDAAAYIRSLAEKRGRNAKWAEEAVRKSVSITEREALKLRVIDLVAESLPELLAALDGRKVTTRTGTVTLETKNAKVTEIEPSFRDKVLRVISDPTVAYVLMLIGLAGLYFELSNPGAILPGVLGSIALILAFYAFQTLPINYAGLLLILLAVVLFVAEALVVSHGILTMGGIGAMLIGSIMLIDAPAPYLRISLPVIAVVTALTAGFFVYAVGATVRSHRRRPTTGQEGLVSVVGTAKTRLAPEGLIAVRGETWTALCDEVVEPGESVVVTEIKGLKLRVQKVKEEATEERASRSVPS